MNPKQLIYEELNEKLDELYRYITETAMVYDVTRKDLLKYAYIWLRKRMAR
jgi:hypothetical protein